MADIELVIKIDEYAYKQIKEYYENNDIVEAIYSDIYFGTPLPKGHGDLYDERDLKKLGNVYFQEVITKDSNVEFHFPELIIDAKPIIEADKENKE